MKDIALIGLALWLLVDAIDATRKQTIVAKGLRLFADDVACTSLSAWGRCRGHTRPTPPRSRGGH
jgi:hypothetical protein